MKDTKESEPFGRKFVPLKAVKNQLTFGYNNSHSCQPTQSLPTKIHTHTRLAYPQNSFFLDDQFKILITPGHAIG